MAGDLLFGRKIKVTIATKVSESFTQIEADVVEIENLRVAFKVSKSDKKEPNTCEITITNLSETRRKSLQQKGVKFILQAGYEASGIGQIFIGDARTCEHKRDGASWHTTIKSGDGERAFNFARVNESFAAGSPVSDVVKRIASKLGLGLGNTNKQAAQLTGQYVNGYAAQGPASRELDKVLAGTGYDWSIQDGELLLLKHDEPSGATVPDIGPDTGLIGSPEYGSPETIHKQVKKTGKPLLKVRCLLNPAIKIGCQVSIRSERHKGPIRVKKLEHTGDTAGGDWYTDFEGVPL
jgi:hypothetical protein